MNIPTHSELLASIDRFLARHPAIGESRFGRDICGEPGLVARLRKGSSPTLNMLERISDFMAAKDEAAGVDHDDADTAPSVAHAAGNATANSPEVTHA